MTIPERTIPRTWISIITNELADVNLFTDYAAILEDIDATSDDATDRMIELCESMITNYTAAYIQKIFALNYVANQKKYADLVELYEWEMHPFFNEYENEEYRHTRTPELQTQSYSSGSGSADTTRNQTQTTTITPGVTTTNTHSVQPYDASGLRIETQDATSETGYNTNSISYTGSPDHTATSSSASSTVTQGGSDLNEYEKKRLARKGVTSEIIKDGLKAIDYRDVLDIIIEDLADQIFLQMWI